MEGNGTEKGSAPRREIGPSLAPSPPAPLAPAALVHFLLSKIMTMLIFLTREEFFKLTCNQTQLWVLGGRERAGARGEGEVEEGTPGPSGPEARNPPPMSTITRCYFSRLFQRLSSLHSLK